MNAETHPTDLPELPNGQFGSRYQQPQHCDEIDPAIPAHSIGATDPDEAAQINALLAECPRSAAELAAYSQLATRLLYSATPATAPRSIAARLQGAIGAQAVPSSVASKRPMRPRSPLLRRPTPRSTPVKRPPKRVAPLPAAMANYALQPDDQLAHKGQQPPIGLTTTPKQPRRWYFGRALATAAATLLLVLNGALLWQNQQLQSQQASLATDLAEQNQALILLAAEEPQEIEIFDPEGLSTARADILWNNSLRLAVVYVRDFPQCESGMKYQLWLTKNGERRSGGLFSVDASGMGLLVVPLEQSIDAYDVIGITPEPAGGSPGPTAPPIVRGEI
jgi:anti-sigma-K factor RskA